MRNILVLLLLTAAAMAQSSVTGNEPDFSAEVRPAQITADQNDYQPNGICNGKTVTVLLNTDASRNITGFACGSVGRVLIIQNNGAQSIVLKNASASSTAANRLAIGADVTITANQGVTLRYDIVGLRWRLIAGAGSGSAATLDTILSPVADTNWTVPNANTIAITSGTATTTVNLLQLLSGTGNTGTGYLAYFKSLGAQNILKLECGAAATTTRAISQLNTSGVEKVALACDGTLTLATGLALTATGGGTNTVTFAAPAAVTASYTITPPGAAANGVLLMGPTGALTSSSDTLGKLFMGQGSATQPAFVASGPRMNLRRWEVTQYSGSTPTATGTSLTETCVSGTLGNTSATASSAAYRTYTTGATSALNCGYHDNPTMAAGTNLVFQSRFKWDSTAAGNVLYWLGMSDASEATMSASGQPTFFGAGIRYCNDGAGTNCTTDDTKYVCVLNNNGAQTLTASTLAIDAVEHTLQITETSGNYTFLIDNASIGCDGLTTGAPTAGTNLRKVFAQATWTTAARVGSISFLYRETDR